MRPFLPLLAVFVLAAIPASARTHLPLLNSEVVVYSSIVTIGDLFDDAGIAGERPVFRSPEPGTIGRVPVEMVSRAVRAAGLEEFELGGLKHISVERAGRTVDAVEVTNNLRDRIAERLDITDAKMLKVSLSRGIEATTVPAEADRPFVISQLDLTSSNSRFRAVVDFNGASGKKVRISGRITELVEVARLANAVARGKVLRKTDVSLDLVPRNRAKKHAGVDPSDLIGKVAKRSLRVGQVLDGGDFTIPMLIEKNRMVTIIYKMPGLVLTARGRTTESAADGEMISVVNLRSKRVVVGVATTSSTVVVQGNPRQIAGLNGGGR